MLDIIIVNWNAGHLLTEVVISIMQHHNSHVASVIIVDNASVDDSIVGVEALLGLPFPLHIVRNTENRGFAAACNQGAALADGEFLLFLNPDTRLFAQSLASALTFMQRAENSGVGIIGIQLVGEQSNVARSCARFPNSSDYFAAIFGLDRIIPRIFQSVAMTEWDHAETRSVDHVIGAFYLVRRSCFTVVGGFDERFFVYLEDLDFSLRARHAGWGITYLADAQAFHKGGGTSEKIKAKRLFYSLQSRILYSYKNFNWWSATGVTFGTLLLEPIARLVMGGLLHRSLTEMKETVIGYTLLIRAMPKIIKIVKASHS